MELERAIELSKQKVKTLEIFQKLFTCAEKVRIDARKRII